jgi:EPS-associated MarR family transcriptional regulator
MAKNIDSIDNLNIMRKIQNKPELSQRQLAQELDFSLGKINYCLSALKIKGLIKISNFKKNNNKLNYFYILTPKGFIKKTNLTLKFMKLKMAEYDELQKELLKEKNQQ